MDLTDMLKEASIIDHSWYKQGLLQPGEPTFDPAEEGIKKRNNIKPELEVDWGGAGPNIDIEAPAGEVKRNIPDESLAGAKDVIVFARDQMNRGKMGKKLTGALKAKFDPKSLKAAAGELRKLFALEGIIGCIAVDGRGYKSCQDAIKAASNSPYKGFIKYVIGCQCGDPHLIPTGAGTAVGTLASSSGNAVDDFFASEAPQKTAMVSHCRSTMMPILGWRGDLDQSMTDETMINLQNMTGLNESQYASLQAKRKSGKISSNLALVREAFRMQNAHSEIVASQKYAASVDSSEHIVRQADTEIEFGAMPMGDLDVDPTNYAIQQEVEPVAPTSTDFEGPPSLFSELSSFDLVDKPVRPECPVELAEDGMRVEVGDEMSVSEDLDVDIQRIVPTDISQVGEFDVDMNIGDQKIMIDRAPVSQPDMDVDIQQNISDEDTDVSPLAPVNVDMRGRQESIRIDRVPARQPEVDVDIQRTIPTDVAPLDAVDVDMRGEEEGILFDNVPTQPDIDVNPQGGGMEAEFDLFQSLGDVDMSQYNETEFEGVDEVELDEKHKPRGQLDVQMTQDMGI